MVKDNIPAVTDGCGGVPRLGLRCGGITEARQDQISDLRCFPLKITQAVLPITLRSQFKTLYVVCNEVPLCLDMLHVICTRSLAIMPVYISNTSFC